LNDGAYSTHGRDEKCKKLVVGPEGKRLVGRPRPRWEYNINVVYVQDEGIVVWIGFK
jgi:hypothetical protein